MRYIQLHMTVRPGQLRAGAVDRLMLILGSRHCEWSAIYLYHMMSGTRRANQYVHVRLRCRAHVLSSGDYSGRWAEHQDWYINIT